MEVLYESSITGRKIFDSSPTNFYTDVAKRIAANEHGKGTVRIEIPDGHVIYSVGIRSGTQVVNEMENTLPALYNHGYGEKYLTCIIPEKNSYKFYHMTLKGNEFVASYGRMGTEKGQLFGERSCVYPISAFWAKYFEKIGKGYIDNSDIYLQAQSADKENIALDGRTALAETASGRLYALLIQLAQKAVRNAKVQVPVTAEIISAAKRYLEQMRNSIQRFFV